ncbi:hypothetical protein TNCV_753241 [Trichonephila clavipes]|uniref:Uncharacterized protein n=1 Tax=Trichonephila clavipes TaxID=2585209 RepID=A0A8X7BH08_TRICX|nr:hypothetical protein TNCV_753241 [Trichonephila clavipes]
MGARRPIHSADTLTFWNLLYSRGPVWTCTAALKKFKSGRTAPRKGKVIDLPIKKWAGVKAFKSPELLDKGHSGLEFKIPSIWIQTVRNSS